MNEIRCQVNIDLPMTHLEVSVVSGHGVWEELELANSPVEPGQHFDALPEPGVLGDAELSGLVIPVWGGGQGGRSE